MKTMATRIGLPLVKPLMARPLMGILFSMSTETDYFRTDCIRIDVLNSSATIASSNCFSHWGGSAAIGQGLTEMATLHLYRFWWNILDG